MDVESGLSTSESVSGNANLTDSLSPKKTNLQGKFWKVNYHLKDSESFESIIEILKESIIPDCAEYVFGEEFGKSGTTRHIEGGFITRSDRVRFTAIQNKFRFSDLQKSKKKNWGALCKYCTKECNRIVSSPGVPKPPTTIKKADLYPWQEELAEIFSEPPAWDDRTIYWRHGDVNIGKTQFAKYLCVHHDAVVIGGTHKHMLAQVQNQRSNIYIILLSYGDEIVSYRAIEQIKDGLFSSAFGTDNNKMEIRDAPHILVIGNEPPDTSDRHFHPTKYDVRGIGLPNV